MKRFLVLATLVLVSLGIISFAQTGSTSPDPARNSIGLGHQAKTICIEQQKILDKCKADINRTIELAAKNHPAEADDIRSVATRLDVDMPSYPKCALAFGGHHYLGVAQKSSWYDARDVCKAMGGHLLYIETDEEMAFIRKNYGHFGGFWLGAARNPQKDTKGKWFWVNGVPVKESLFAVNRQPWADRYFGAYENNFVVDCCERDNVTHWANGFVCEWDN